jgi:hypothetical protein
MGFGQRPLLVGRNPVTIALGHDRLGLDAVGADAVRSRESAVSRMTSGFSETRESEGGGR